MTPDTITIEFTPGELAACFHALLLQTRFNTLEHRLDNESALRKINQLVTEEEQ
jgi:hypothetical protein